MVRTNSKRSQKIHDSTAHTSSINCLRLSKKDVDRIVTGGDDRKVCISKVGRPSDTTMLAGHTSPVESVAFSESEDWVTAGASSGTIKIWDLAEGKVARTFTGHRGNCVALEYHPFAERFASGSADSSIKLWDPRQKECTLTLKGHSKGVNCIKFSPDGRWLVSGGEDSLVKLWDITTGKVLHEFRGHTDQIRALDFHPFELFLATGSQDRSSKFWDLETFGLVGSAGPETSAVRGMLFTPDGRALLTSVVDNLKVWGWEPVRCHDLVSVGWSKVADLSFKEGKLYGASFSFTSVKVWAVDLSRVAPFGTKEDDPSESVESLSKQAIPDSLPESREQRQRDVHSGTPQTRCKSPMRTATASATASSSTATSKKPGRAHHHTNLTEATRQRMLQSRKSPLRSSINANVPVPIYVAPLPRRQLERETQAGGGGPSLAGWAGDMGGGRGRGGVGREQGGEGAASALFGQGGEEDGGKRRGFMGELSRRRLQDGIAEERGEEEEDASEMNVVYRTRPGGSIQEEGEGQYSGLYRHRSSDFAGASVSESGGGGGGSTTMGMLAAQGSVRSSFDMMASASSTTRTRDAEEAAAAASPLKPDSVDKVKQWIGDIPDGPHQLTGGAAADSQQGGDNGDDADVCGEMSRFDLGRDEIRKHAATEEAEFGTFSAQALGRHDTSSSRRTSTSPYEWPMETSSELGTYAAPPPAVVPPYAVESATESSSTRFSPISSAAPSSARDNGSISRQLGPGTDALGLSSFVGSTATGQQLPQGNSITDTAAATAPAAAAGATTAAATADLRRGDTLGGVPLAGAAGAAAGSKRRVSLGILPGMNLAGDVVPGQRAVPDHSMGNAGAAPSASAASAAAGRFANGGSSFGNADVAPIAADTASSNLGGLEGDFRKRASLQESTLHRASHHADPPPPRASISPLLQPRSPSLGPIRSPSARSPSFSSRPLPPQQRSLSPRLAAKPLGLDMASFMPPEESARQVHMAPNDAELLAKLREGHGTFLKIMKSRLLNTQKAKQLWIEGDMRGVLDLLSCLQDSAVLVDILNILRGKGGRVSVLNVDGCAALLPLIHPLLSSRHESHIQTALGALHELLRVFGDLITTTRLLPKYPGVDIHAEQRLERCNSCYDAFKDTSPLLQPLFRKGHSIGRVAQELHAALECL